jgi:OOP family OmpA-OmpF porin
MRNFSPQFAIPSKAPWLVWAAKSGLTMMALLATLTSASLAAQDAIVSPNTASAVGRIVISGAVPDEETKAALLARLQEIYGPNQVDDRISVGGVTAPSDWSLLVPRLMTHQLKSISKGRLTVEGKTISLRGEVGSESVRQEVANSFARTLNPTYIVKNGLRVTTQNQTMLDNALGDRIIEFEPGSALLTGSGKRILDDMAEVMKKIGTAGIEVIGHTDDTGTLLGNMALSRARADSVKAYLVAKGIRSELIGTSGMGADLPIASNATDEGRRRNRRIEFRASR